MISITGSTQVAAPSQKSLPNRSSACPRTWPANPPTSCYRTSTLRKPSFATVHGCFTNCGQTCKRRSACWCRKTEWTRRQTSPRAFAKGRGCPPTLCRPREVRAGRLAAAGLRAQLRQGRDSICYRSWRPPEVKQDAVRRKLQRSVERARHCLASSFPPTRSGSGARNKPAAQDHPSALPAPVRSSAITMGPRENSPRLAFPVRSRK